VTGGRQPAPRAGVEVAAAGALPGALGGALLAGLIFFLNPDLPFGAASVARGTAVYAALGALAGLAATFPFLRRRRARARRALPWLLTLVLAAAAVAVWTHASRFAFFLPPGINVRMIKAAVLLSLAALIAFYTALLHSLHRRRYGPRSRLVFALLAAAALYVMVERREAFRPPPARSPRPSMVESQERPRLLVVGIDGATLDALLPAAGGGRLPFLDEVIRGGAYGRLSTLAAERRTALWTTLATGKYPYRHGVVAERVYPAPWLAPGATLELLPAGIGFARWGTFGARPRRADATDRRVLALWEILPRLGVPCGVVGWPGSDPVDGAGARFALAERFFEDPAAAGAAAPPELRERARLFRPRADDVAAAFGPGFGDPPPPEARAALAADLWRESLTRFLLEQHRDLGAVFLQLDGLAAASRRDFGGFWAARHEGVQDEAYQRSAERLEAYYAHLDGFLAALWRDTPPPRILAVVSAYGVSPPSGARRAWGELWGRPALAGGFGGAPDGLLVLYGDGIRAPSLLTGARLVDLAPTLLYSLGAPVARDLDGRVLTSAFDRPHLARRPLSFLPSYETLTTDTPTPVH
jgi:uncharacterized membrane-anchored protein